MQMSVLLFDFFFFVSLVDVTPSICFVEKNENFIYLFRFVFTARKNGLDVSSDRIKWCGDTFPHHMPQQSVLQLEHDTPQSAMTSSEVGDALPHVRPFPPVPSGYFHVSVRNGYFYVQSHATGENWRGKFSICFRMAVS